MTRSALVVTLIALAHPAAAADSPWPAMVKAGLTGTWAHDCSAPPSGANWVAT